jgi:hypothetical protein
MFQGEIYQSTSIDEPEMRALVAETLRREYSNNDLDFQGGEGASRAVERNGVRQLRSLWYGMIGVPGTSVEMEM